jgi:ABC-type sulfate transport system permease component
MEAFVYPILFAISKKLIAAALVLVFWFVALRVADKVLDIRFKEEWDAIKDDRAKVSYWNTRMIAFAIMLLGCFALV